MWNSSAFQSAFKFLPPARKLIWTSIMRFIQWLNFLILFCKSPVMRGRDCTFCQLGYAPSSVQSHVAVHSEIDSQEERSGATHQGPGEPRLFPSHNTIPSQDHLTPALQLLLQLGRFLSLNTKWASMINYHTFIHNQTYLLKSVASGCEQKFPIK